VSPASNFSTGFATLPQDAQRIARIGLLGGTFDPVHFGHLLLAEQAYEHFGLDGVIFIPTGRPVRKLNATLSASEDRYKMLMLAIGDNLHFEVSRVELDRSGVTYTIDTVRAIRESMGEQAELFFISGADATYDLGTWKDANELAQLVTVLGSNRGGVDERTLLRTQQQLGFNVLDFRIPALDISAQDIRERIQTGRSVRYLLPEAVLAYIVEHRLYGAGGNTAVTDGGD
jgi:nicotinate-nucleotide adenylyltransferase